MFYDTHKGWIVVRIDSIWALNSMGLLRLDVNFNSPWATKVISPSCSLSAETSTSYIIDDNAHHLFYQYFKEILDSTLAILYDSLHITLSALRSLVMLLVIAKDQQIQIYRHTLHNRGCKQFLCYDYIKELKKKAWGILELSGKKYN